MSAPLHRIAPRCRVTLHLSLATTGGLEFLSTFDEEPSEIALGSGELAEGLELALYGLRAGDEQTITLAAEQAFGSYDPGLVRYMERAEFGDEIVPEAGLVVAFNTPEGEELAGTILSVEGERVQVDLNHPLAGRDVVFRVRILAVELPPFEPES